MIPVFVVCFRSGEVGIQFLGKGFGFESSPGIGKIQSDTLNLADQGKEIDCDFAQAVEAEGRRLMVVSQFMPESPASMCEEGAGSDGFSPAEQAHGRVA